MAKSPMSALTAASSDCRKQEANGHQGAERAQRSDHRIAAIDGSIREQRESAKGAGKDASIAAMTGSVRSAGGAAARASWRCRRALPPAASGRPDPCGRCWPFDCGDAMLGNEGLDAVDLPSGRAELVPRVAE